MASTTITTYVLFQPTKLFDWEPDPYYNLTEVEHHPTMPKSVKDSISMDTVQCTVYRLDSKTLGTL